ncbi:hypothetical protein B0H19DRAFT_1160673 [Mycena capillaripes]|nr:hypothetical protein B0H19DRAFT_1160673 [Mycena capillaripes]
MDERTVHNVRSPILRLPSELLELIALHLATRPPNLGPPAALLPLLSSCLGVYERLGWGQNWGLWAKLGRAKFTDAYPSYPYLDDDDFGAGGDPHGGRIRHAAHTFRTRCTALSILRTGDPYAPGAGRALKIAYGMLVEDDWGGAALDFTQVDMALGRTPVGNGANDGDWHADGKKGKNRRQLLWAGARAFALRYVTGRLHEGRWGEHDPIQQDGGMRNDLVPPNSERAWRAEWSTPAWRAGWPRDADGAAAALWVLWFFEGEDNLRAEPEPLRRHLMTLLLPLVVAPFRYTSTLAPPHHYSIPLLPEVYLSSAFHSQEVVSQRGQGITIPTHHGAYPIYALGAPSPSHSTSTAPPSTFVVGSRQSRAQAQARRQNVARLLCAPPARLLFFARMQTGARMGVPPHLPRDRTEGNARWVANGGVGPPPVSPTQEDIHEKNTRPLVRFERTSVEADLGVDPDIDASFLDGDDPTYMRNGRDERWAAHRWRARLCREYTAGWVAGSNTEVPPGLGLGRRALPGHIGRVYTLGSFAGLWTGTMLMPSEPAYNALVDTVGGGFPPGGLVRDDFVAAARPVYMRIQEHWSFHPHQPVPPPAPDSTTADEGLRSGWLPPGAEVVGVSGGQVEVQVPAVADPSDESTWGRRPETATYIYHTVLDAHASAAGHPAHDVESCSGCIKVKERKRWERGRALRTEDVSPSHPSSSHSDHTPPYEAPLDALWPEWDAPAWAAHGFDEGDVWESACDGVQDVIFTGATDPRHGMAWHHYEYAGRVRPWDGLIGLVMRPRDRTLGLATFFISGHLVGRDTFEGTWQMASQDVLAPSWGGSVCLARGEK